MIGLSASLAASLLALLAAACAATGYAVTKGLVASYPPRELIGPLFALNAALFLPLAPFVAWHWTWPIVLLLALSVITMVVLAGVVFALLVRGSAASVSTSQALSPIAVMLLSAVLLPGQVGLPEIVAAILVAVAVVWVLSGVYEGLAPWHAAVLVGAVAFGHGLLTVLSKLLTDSGAGIVEIYLLRTALAATIWTAACPPRHIPMQSIPRLSVRAGFVTTQFALLLGAIQLGNPITVQTLFATSPIMLLIGSCVVHRQMPRPRIALGAVLVVTGVALVLGSAVH